LKSVAIAPSAGDHPFAPQLQRGSPYDRVKVDQSIKALFATGIFSDARIERRGTTVHVRVVENPIVSACPTRATSPSTKPSPRAG
jgi:outer membrane protein assembly factor BamA